ncbi:MAG: polysaccharide biosynthesis protein PslG [Thermoleophilaceae bacterium]|nr:polysaccharide biosynthesis protein PslG [Thermoleophilaceae bacterium]
MALSPLRRLLIAATASLALVAAAPSTAGAEQLHGAAVHSLWSGSSTSDWTRELDMLHDAGANAIRLDLSWSSMETDGKGQYASWYIQKTDAVIQAAQDRGIKVVATLWSTPCWASSAPDTLKQSCAGAWWDRGVDRYPPSNMNDYGDAVAFVAKRWGSKLASLEIWNEPNLPDQYTLHSADPAASYAQILKAAYPRAKAEAPSLPVLAGALSGSDGDFMQRLYTLGIKGNFDGFSIHPYNEWRDPDDPWLPEWRKWSFLKGPVWIHDILGQHGDGDKGVWLTEFGFSSCKPGADRWCVDQAQQAEYTKDSFRIARTFSFVKAALVYNLRNKGTDPTDRESQFGLINRDFSPKPAFAAFREAMAGYSADPTPPDTTSTTSAPVDPAPVPVVTAPGGVTVDSSGVAPVPVKCKPGKRTCVGTITIQATQAQVTRKTRARSKSKRRVTLGSRRVRVKPGQRLVVRIKLSTKHRRALARLGHLRVTVNASAKPTALRRTAVRMTSVTLRTTRMRRYA